MARHFYLIASAIFAFTLLSTDIAQACLGVSRTVTARGFNANMGMGGSAGLGLRNKEVILTFDDGPKSSTTKRILRALSAECTKATFFVLGRMARSNPKLLQQIARSGHTIAQHTNDHPNLTRLSIAQAENEINRGIASVNLALGSQRRASTRLFRYPYLARSSRLDAMLKRKGLLPVSAGIDSNDWKSGSGAAMVNRVMAQLKRRGRGVILMHDIQNKTASALPSLLRRLKQGGYRVVHLRGSGAPRTNVIASRKQEPKATRLASRKKKSRAVRVAALQTKKRKSFGFFRKRDNGLPGVDTITTGSVKKRSVKRTSKQRLKRKKLEKKVRKGFFARLRERRLERAQALAAKQSAKKRIKKTNRKVKKKTRVSKRVKKTKKKSWFAKRREARLARAEERKAALKKRNKRKLTKRSKRKTKRVAKNSTKRKSLFGRLFKRIARKRAESDRSYGLRLYDDLLNLEQENKELTKLMKVTELPLDQRPEVQSLLKILRPLASK